MTLSTHNDTIDLSITPLAPPRLSEGMFVACYAIEFPGFELSNIPGNSERALFYCSTPNAEIEYLAIGSVDDVTAENYFSLPVAARDVFKNVSEDASTSLPDRFTYISFPFESSSEIPYARFVMPEFLIKKEGELYTVRLNLPGVKVPGETELLTKVKTLLAGLREYGSIDHHFHSISIIDDSKEYFADGVNRIKSAISSGIISKGVISRDRKISFSGNFSIPKAIRDLRINYPDCTVVFTNYPGRNFIAATPERLFRLEGNTVLTEALAGSIKTEDNEPDQSIVEDRLLHSEKDVREHLIVRDYLISKLKPVASNIDFPPVPGVKKLSNVTHLRTGIKARLKEGVSAVELGRLLFPTPALCGEPMEVAAELINSVEKRKRDLYGGVTGFITNGGVSEFFVSIRCGFIDENEATLYAGCGIVADSDPESEYEETNLKFIPLTSLFTDENKS